VYSRICILASALIAACGGSSSDATGVTPISVDTFDIKATLLGGPAVFVLAEVDGKSAEPAITFDHQCTAGHLVTYMRDSVVVASTFISRKATRSDTYLNDASQTGVTLILNGTWATYSGSDRYYSAGPSIQLDLVSANGNSAGSTPFRLGGTTRLMRMSAIGGSCPGSANDGRTVLFVYTRR
jgi:hypothetical protein